MLWVIHPTHGPSWKICTGSLCISPDPPTYYASSTTTPVPELWHDRSDHCHGLQGRVASTLPSCWWPIQEVKWHSHAPSPQSGPDFGEWILPSSRVPCTACAGSHTLPSQLAAAWQKHRHCDVSLANTPHGINADTFGTCWLLVACLLLGCFFWFSSVLLMFYLMGTSH